MQYGLLALAACGLSSSAPGGAALTASQGQALQAYDFLTALQALPTFAPGTVVYQRETGSTCPARLKRTAAENRVVSLHQFADGSYHDYKDTATAVLHYIRQHGQMPKSGLDLFPELQTQAGYDAFMALSPARRVEQYFAGVNQVTGHFYQDMLTEKTEPGGFTGTHVTSPDFVYKGVRVNCAMFFMGKDNATAIFYTVWGEDPKSWMVSNGASL